MFQQPVPTNSKGRQRADGLSHDSKEVSTNQQYKVASNPRQRDSDLHHQTSISSHFDRVMTFNAGSLTSEKPNNSRRQISDDAVAGRSSSSASDHGSPLSSRPSSGKPRSVRRSSSTKDGDLPEIREMSARPGSSRYKVLPSITNAGDKSHRKSSSSEAHFGAALTARPGEARVRKDATRSSKSNPQTISRDKVTVKEHDVQSKIKSSRKTSKTTTTDNLMSGSTAVKSHEPTCDEERVLIAVKLPTGERLQRDFRPTDRLAAVMQFAGQDVTSCEFVRADTRAVLSDLQISIRSAGVVDRTVLLIQLPAK